MTRSAGLKQEVLLNYQTVLSTVQSPHYPSGIVRADESDYVASNGTLSFAPDVTSQTFTVEIVDDDIPEPAEALFVQLVSVELVEQGQERKREWRRPMTCHCLFRVI